MGHDGELQDYRTGKRFNGCTNTLAGQNTLPGYVESGRVSGINGMHVMRTQKPSPYSVLLDVCAYAFLIKSSHMPLSSSFTDSKVKWFFSQYRGMLSSADAGASQSTLSIWPLPSFSRAFLVNRSG